MMTGELIKDEKDLVVLLGSFVMYRQVDLLYELILYIESYSTEDLAEIINEVKKNVSDSLMKWFTNFLLTISDRELINELAKYLYDNTLIALVNDLNPALVEEFVELWDV